MSKKEYPFRVVEGDGQKALSRSFTPPTLAVVEKKPTALLPPPSVFRKSAAPKKNKLRYSTTNPFMRKVIDAYQNAADSQQKALAVIWDNHAKQPIFIPILNDKHLADIISTEYSDILVWDENAQHQPVCIFDDTSKPFEGYVTKDQIKKIRDWRDLAHISMGQVEQNHFDDPYGELPEIDPSKALEELTSRAVKMKRNPYSKKFQQIEEIFEEAKDFDGGQFGYIYLNPEDELAFIITQYPCPINIVKQSLPEVGVVGTFDLHDSFEGQLRACDFDPTQDVTWADLIEYPVDCINAEMKSLAPTSTQKGNVVFLQPQPPKR